MSPSFSVPHICSHQSLFSSTHFQLNRTFEDVDSLPYSRDYSLLSMIHPSYHPQGSGLHRHTMQCLKAHRLCNSQHPAGHDSHPEDAIFSFSMDSSLNRIAYAKSHEIIVMDVESFRRKRMERSTCVDGPRATLQQSAMPQSMAYRKFLRRWTREQSLEHQSTPPNPNYQTPTVLTLRGHHAVVTKYLFSRINHNISYSASLDKTLRIWDSDQSTHLVHMGDWVRAVQPSPVTERYVLAGNAGSMISLYDQHSGHILFSFNNLNSINPKDPVAHELNQTPNWLNSVNSLAFQKSNAAENMFLAGFRDGRVKFYDTRTIGGGCTKLPQQQSRHGETPVFGSTTPRTTPHTTHAARHICNDKSTRQVEIFSLVAHGEVQEATKVNHCEFLSDNNYFVTSGRDSSIRLFDLRMINNGAHHRDVSLREWNKHQCVNYNLNLQITEDDLMITGSEDGKVYIYDLYDTSFCHTLQYHATATHEVFAAQGRILSTSIDSAEIILWEPDLSNEHQETLVPREPDRDTQREQWLFSQLMNRYSDEIVAKYHCATPSQFVYLHLTTDFLRQLVEDARKSTVLTPEDVEEYTGWYSAALSNSESDGIILPVELSNSMMEFDPEVEENE